MLHISRDKLWHHEREADSDCRFRIGCQLQFTERSSLWPSRILLHSLEGFGTISSIHVELGRLKNITQPCIIITTRHLFYLLYMGWCLSHEIESRAHPLTHVGEPGNQVCLVIRFACLVISITFCMKHCLWFLWVFFFPDLSTNSTHTAVLHINCQPQESNIISGEKLVYPQSFANSKHACTLEV